MLRITGISLPIDHDVQQLRDAVADRLGVQEDLMSDFHVRRKSVDARKLVSFVYTIDVEVPGQDDIIASGVRNVKIAPDMIYQMPSAVPAKENPPIIVGTGPAGLFAGLILAEAGLNPILLERGKPAKERAADVAEFWNTGKLNTESNALFGEGGAGTFSDGKLTTQIKDKHNRCWKVLQELVEAGSPDEIMYLAKPHIGTDILVSVVEKLRKKIRRLGGQVRFNSCVSDVIITDGKASGVVLADGEEIHSDSVVMAIGHSARDTFGMLYKRGVEFQQKAFSIGARIEHPQELIDKAQFGKSAGHPALGRADYKLVHHASNGRGVYTFCMCPGGTVMATSSNEGEIVTNGMSTFRRDNENANSALLVSVKPEDFGSDHPLAGIEYQRKWERAAFKLGGSNYHAPAQRVKEFLAKKPSTGCVTVKPTYKPGVKYCDISKCLPKFVVDAMREALPALDKKLRRFSMGDAILTAPETRSSSPVRIVRNKDFESVSVSGLYPAGEGAGYSGGIVSAAVDGIKIAEKIVLRGSPGC